MAACRHLGWPMKSIYGVSRMSSCMFNQAKKVLFAFEDSRNDLRFIIIDDLARKWDAEETARSCKDGAGTGRDVKRTSSRGSIED
jgi:hypothetical protein